MCKGTSWMRLQAQARNPQSPWQDLAANENPGGMDSRGAIAHHSSRLARPGMTSENSLDRFSRIRHRRREAAVNRDRLSVDVGCLVAGEEQSHRREFVRLPGALQRIELADLVGGTALLGAIEHRLGHAGLDQAGGNTHDAET